ncbi:hypothetical protein JYK14_19750 [Siccirubricoccus sp. KC 17139]|uniref:Uncharacterized protein n=1 Tax=Siccirubricoccus soli TaxID=2899147 RepID=A0ABT1D9U7_9PROT|nr:hypothetical protein [Siccirubricoccus soli]MCO6418382.1 hypothetical protein [Siccirubricoccus soli]MCP2684517.1 hypothetical protein [Siccirubricoccus soli]
MTEEQAAALEDLWPHAQALLGSMQDVAKRCALGEKALKDVAAEVDGWKGAYQAVLGMKAALRPGIKAATKMVAETNRSAKELAKLKPEDVIKSLKKYDKPVDLADASVAAFVIWRRKLSKEIGMQVSSQDFDMLALMKNVERYLVHRAEFNKGLQKFQRLARG